MTGLQHNPFARPKTSWPRALAWSAAINAVLAAAVRSTSASAPRADNPLAFYIAAIVQFPSSLLFINLPGSSSTATIVAAEVAVILVQVSLMALLIRKPWRR